MAVEAGAVYVPIRPSFRGFQSRVKKPSTQAGQESAGAFSRAFNAKLTAAFQSLPKAKVDVDVDTLSDAEYALLQLRNRLEELSHKTIGVDIDAETALAEAAKLEAELKQLLSEDHNIQINTDAAAALSALEALHTSAERLDGKEVNVKVNKTRDGFHAAFLQASALTTAVIALAPAAIPVVAAVGAGALGMGAAFGAAGIAAAGFAAVAIPQLTEIAEVTKKMEAAQLRANKATTDKARAAALAEEKRLWDSLTPAQQRAYKQIQAIRKVWEQTSNRLAAPVLDAITPWIATAKRGLTFLPSLVKPAAVAIQALGQRAKTALAAPFWKQWFDDIGNTGAAGIAVFGTVVGRLAQGFAALFQKFLPIGSQMLPKILDLASGFNAWANSAKSTEAINRFLGYVRSVAPQVLAFFQNLGPAVVNIWRAVMPLAPVSLAVATALAQLVAAVPPGVLTGLVAGFVALKIATAAWAAAMWAAHGVSVLVAAVTKIWTAAQWLLNVALSANPIGIVIIAVAALVAGIILLWKHSETFRNIVMAAWRGISTAALWAWNTVLKPIFNAVKWYITNILIPQWRFIWNVVKIVWAGISAAIRFAWGIIKPIFGFIKWYIVNIVARNFTFLWNIVKFAWFQIQLQIKVAWAVIKVIFNAIRAVIRNVIAPVFRWLWANVIRPVWNGIKDTIVSVWRNHIRPAFDALKSAVSAVRDRFRTAVDGIKRIWKGIEQAAKKPVNFVIGVYNDGIVGLVNKIANFAGIKTRLSKIPKLAHGGVLPGYSPGRDKLLAAVSPGESVFRPEFTRAVGSDWVGAANTVARKRGVGGVKNWLGQMGGEGLTFSRGGVVPGYAGNFAFGGIIDNFIKGVKDFSILDVGKSVKGVIDRVLGTIPGSGIFRDVIAGIPKWMSSTLVKWVKDKVSFGGPGISRALAWAKTQSGKPYIWGGVGPRGYDCSGFMSAITNVIKGRRPYSRLFTTHSFNGRTGPGGFVRNLPSGFRVGVTNAGVGHMAGTLGRVPVESSGSRGVRVGGGARGATNGLFGARYGLRFDNGGYLPEGLSLNYNGTGRPEPVLTSGDWSAIHSLAKSGGSSAGSTNYTINARTADFSVRDLETLQRQQEARARIGRPR